MTKLQFPLTVVFILGISVASAACTESTTRDDAGSTDSATPTDTAVGDTAITDTAVDSGPLCVPVTCEIACMYGFARDASGCEICECAVAPDDSCTAGGECTLAYDAAACCGCPRGYAAARVDREPCLVREGEPVPPGCPRECGDVFCEACEPFTGASCSGDVCIGTMD